MSSDSTTTVRPRVGILRILFPVVVLAAATAAILVAHTWKNTEIDASSLSIVKMLAVLVAAGLLLLWALRMPGWRKRYVWLAFVGFAGLGLAAFKPIGMRGNFLPIFVARDWVLDTFFGGSRDTILERHRESQAKTDGGADLTVKPGDWPEYRGPNRDGVVTGPAIARDWSAHPPKEVWRQPIGGGYAAFAVANGFLVTIEQRRDREVVACYRADTGQEVWTTGWAAKFTDPTGDGPRATPTIAHGDVFALGALGRLVCLNGADGTEKWAVETLEGNANVQWGMSGSPLVVDDLVIVNPGAQTEEAQKRAVRAYDRKTGKEVRAEGSSKAGYSSPQLVTLLGHRQVLIFDAFGLTSYGLDTRARLWRYEWKTSYDVNSAQPLVIGDDRLVIGSGYNQGGALLKVSRNGDTWAVAEVWRSKNTVMRYKYASPVHRKTADGGDYIYGLNDGILECVDAKTGKQVWKHDARAKEGEAFGHGQILLADDLIVALTEFGELVLVEATPTAYKELGRIKALKEGEKTWNNPAMVGGRVYIRNAAEMACYDLAGK